MTLKGRIKLFIWNYNALFSTISASKEYIADYVQNNSALKSLKRAGFNLSLIIREILLFRRQVIITDYNYMYLQSLFDTLNHYNVKGLELAYVDPMNMDRKNLSFIFVMNFPQIKKSIDHGQRLEVLSAKPKKGTLLEIISNITQVKTQLEKRQKNDNASNMRTVFKEESPRINSYPDKLFIELTRNCNCSCIMCGREKPSYDKSLNMSLGLFKKIADHFFPYADYVDLRGFGESSLIHNIDEYIDYALKYKCDFGLITNLTVKNDNLWAKLVLNNFWIGVSFDGAKKETYEKIRIHGKYDNVIHNFGLIRDISKKHNIANRVYLIVTVQKDNIDELDDILRIAKQYGIKQVELSPVISPHDNDPYSLDLVAEKIKPNISRAIALAEKLGINLRLIGTFGLEQKEKESGHKLMERCPRPWSWLYINYNGLTGPCNHLMDPLFILGDLSKANNFHDVLNNESNQLMRSIVHTPYRYKSCEWCFKNRYDY
jgi:MoaA/NifB/PqqE/SkfB family radical SAM enzyme